MLNTQEITREIAQLKTISMIFMMVGIIMLGIVLYLIFKYKLIKPGKEKKREWQAEENTPNEPVKKAIDIDEGIDETVLLSEVDEEQDERFEMVKDITKTHTTEHI